ncbi:hypothetical protein A1O1_02437 [Capronia coronata CBS 617.96]|uniref:Uncharacterized protein n=1 Tax=Capronia coronata CBS 617.96 TaxID=1182541 RepID=W9ZHT3_9EURO|nr:uncharacterized protein A1O1_02437 [Capronia coronata CBS 617.96]EXJ94044.1 hypothetical protein A1O1_02437 [Capronia coronata CBS 617.96]
MLSSNYIQSSAQDKTAWSKVLAICSLLSTTYSAPLFARTVTTTKGDAPNASNVNKEGPQSDSPQEQGVKSSRATGGEVQDTASVAEPTGQVGSGNGQDEEGGAPGTKDPNKSADQKSAEVQKEGMKPLDPADK